MMYLWLASLQEILMESWALGVPKMSGLPLCTIINFNISSSGINLPTVQLQVSGGSIDSYLFWTRWWWTWWCQWWSWFLSHEKQWGWKASFHDRIKLNSIGLKPQMAKGCETQTPWIQLAFGGKALAGSSLQKEYLAGFFPSQFLPGPNSNFSDVSPLIIMSNHHMGLKKGYLFLPQKKTKYSYV